jgi:hypothetical protein
MAEDNRSLISAETNNETSWYKAFGAGLASGIIKIPEGIISLGAELIDLGADSDTAASVEEFFDKVNIFEDTAEERTIGKLTEAITQIAVPGGIGFKAANALARKLTTKALKAKRKNLYLEFGKGPKFYKSRLKDPTKKAKLISKKYDPGNLREGLNKVNELNKKAKYARFAMAVTGGAVGETLVVDTEDIGTFGDMFEGPTSLDRDESLSGREDATRKLMNRFRFGTESLLITPFAFGVGSTAKSLAKRGKDLAYSNSAFERFIDKYIRAPFSPRDHLPEEVFASEMTKKGLKVKDSHRAKQLVSNITKIVDGIFPVAQEAADKTIKGSKMKFMEQLNEVLLGGDLAKNIDPKKLKTLLNKLEVKNVSKESQELLANALNDGRYELNNLLNILKQTSKGASKTAQTELKELFKKRLEGYVGNSFKIFETKSNIFNFFRKYEPTDEAYRGAIKVFMGGAKRTEQEARKIVDEILLEAQNMKKPPALPDFKYRAKSAETGKLTTLKIGLGADAPGSVAEKRALRKLFGEVKDPRFTLFNGMTNLSALARTSAYFAEVDAKNTLVQSRGGRGFFWDSAEEAAEKLNTKRTGIEIVPMREVLGEIDAAKNLVNPLAGKYTTREIGEGIKTANDVMKALQSFVRGTKDMGGAEKAASWFYRNLLLFPKGISQMAKTIFSIPTHIRNYLSAGAFAGANGILFEGLTNPKLLKDAFQQGIDVSGLLKAGANSPLAQRQYRDLLELGVTNSQVQMGDLISLLKDTNAGASMMGIDNILGRMFKKFKKVGEFLQGKYMAEDDAWKITNFVVELDRIIKASAKRAGQSVDDFKKRLVQKKLPDGSYQRNPELWKLKQQAGEIVKNTVPNYAYVGEFVKTSRLLPIGNFMSFPSEIIRTTTNIAELGLKEMKHSRPTRGSNILPVVFDVDLGAFVKNDNVSYGTGFKRLMGMSTTLVGVPIAVTEGAKALYDVTEDEIEAMRRFVPDWSKHSTLVPIRDDEGDLRYVDLSHSNAYDLVARPFRTLMNNIQEGQQNGDTLLEGFVSGINDASGELMNPFISESIWTEAVNDIFIRGGRTAEGRQLYTDQTSAGDKAAIRLMHVGKALAPSYKQFVRLGQASFGTPDKTGEVLDIGPELAGMMGLRAIKVDPLRAMGFKIAQYQTGIRNARREFTGGVFGLLKGGPISEADIINRYIASNRARFEVQKEMYRDLEGAVTLGETPADLQRTFSERQISSKTYNYLNQGRFDPYFPSKDILKKFREIAAGIDEPDAFAAAAPEVRELRNLFKDLSFDQRFGGFASGGKVTGQLATSGIDSVLPTLIKIRNQLAQLSLEDEFDIGVSEEVVEEQVATPSLPPPILNTPNVNQGNVNLMPNNQQINPVTGLTANQNALVSDPLEREYWRKKNLRQGTV